MHFSHQLTEFCVTSREKTEKGKEMSRKEGLSRTQVGIYKEKDGGGAEREQGALFFFHSGFTPLHMCTRTYIKHTHCHTNTDSCCNEPK